MQVTSVSFNGKYPTISSVVRQAQKISPRSHLCAFTTDPRYKGQITPQKLTQWLDTFKAAEARGNYRELTVL